MLDLHVDPRLRAEIAQLERQRGEAIIWGKQHYGGLWRSKAVRQAAEAQVVEVAKLLRGGIRVSDDRALKLVYALKGVPYIGWSESAQRLGLITPDQLNLGHE